LSYIYLDESGDLGFDFTKKRTTKYFIITILFAPNYRIVQKVVRQVHAMVKRTHKDSGRIMHAYREKPVTIQRLLRKLVEKDIKVMCIYLNKQKVYTRLQDEKAVLYNYVTNILLDRILSRKLINTADKVTLVASRKETSKFLNQNFRDYLQMQVTANHHLPIEIKIKTPHEEKCLQAVDFVSWSIFRKYEYGDDTYYNYIKDVILEENPLFP